LAEKTIDPKSFGKVAVLMGGQSSEREISLDSGKNVLAALLRCDVDAHAIDVGKNVSEQLMGFDRAFVAMHGRGGEDGVIQAVLEYLHMPYTGSGVSSSSLCMNKHLSKQLFKSFGIPTPSFLYLEDAKCDISRLSVPIDFPVVVKPVHEGSSYGITIIQSEDELGSALITAAEYDNQALLEVFIDGPEFTVGILDDEALPVINIKTPEGFYDANAKYYSDETEYLIPSGLSDEKEQELKDLSLWAFKSLGCQHWGRVDVMQDKKGQFWIIDVNTVPGFTNHSLVPMAAKAVGVNFDQLCMRLLAGASVHGIWR